VTEAEWVGGTNPDPMLEFLRGKASERKLRLFAVACLRAALDAPLAEGETAHHALGVGRRLLLACERHADGAVGDRELAASRAEAEAVLRSPHTAVASGWEVRCALRAAGPPEGLPEQLGVLRAEYAHYWAGMWTFYGGAAEVWQQYHDETLERISLQQCQLLRDIVGNPFRPAVVAPAWLAWGGGTAPKLARAVYDEHAFDRLPVLADALEEAGCTDADLLAHLRGPSPHVRGCWVVDLILGKEWGHDGG
jgi:hypothetical protein